MADTEISRPLDVSVVVPVLNGETVINRALDSVFAQTYSNFEIIVVDDGSTDQTVSAVSQRACKQLRLIKHSGNRGAAAARNTGIAAANGRWVAFLDCDDTWKQDKLARQVEALERAGAGVMACATGYYLHKNDHRLTFSLNMRPEKFRMEISFGCTISPGSTLLVNRDVFRDVGTFDESFRRLEDWDWLLRFAKRFDMVFVPTPLADIYVGAVSRPQDIANIAEALDRMRDKHLPHLPKLANSRLRGSLLVEKAAMLYRAGKPFSAAVHIVAALCIYPFRNIAFFRMLWRSVRTGPHPPAKRA
jgi:glycosyltransferase involved in cell wall biosynthesis